MAGWLESMINSFINPTSVEKIKCWVEMDVDTYWHYHKIIEGNGWTDVERKLNLNQVACIGLYTGPKSQGDNLDASDMQYMQGYLGNPGTVKYYNGAE